MRVRAGTRRGFRDSWAASPPIQSLFKACTKGGGVVQELGAIPAAVGCRYSE
jgi:hypothetical protein